MPAPLLLPVRYDDVDTNGHVRGAAYVAYADHARWELVRAAGASYERFAAAGVGPVNLETVVRFKRELRAGDEVAVTTQFTYEQKVGTARQQIHRTSDGELVAEVDSVTGMLDLTTRRLVTGHADRMRELSDDPRMLGLTPR